MLRSRFSSLLATILVLGLLPMGVPNIAHAEGPSIAVDGKVLPGVSGLVADDVTYVPVRAVTEAFGAEVRWSPEARALEARRGSDVVHLYLDLPVAMVNGKLVQLQNPPKVIEDRTYVPLRFLAESLGAKVGWNAQEQQVQITLPQPAVPGGVDPAPVRVLLMPVFHAQAPLKMVRDDYWRLDRPWQSVYLQQRLDAALPGVEGIAVAPLDRVRLLVLEKNKSWDYFGQYIRGNFPAANSGEVPKSYARQLQADCLVFTTLTMTGTGSHTNSLKTEVWCDTGPFSTSSSVYAEVKTTKALPAQESLDALAAEWAVWAKGELLPTIQKATASALQAKTDPYRAARDANQATSYGTSLDEVKALGLLNLPWLKARGTAYLREGKQGQALALLLQAKAMETEPNEAHWLLAQAYLQEGNLAAALPLLQALDSAAAPLFGSDQLAQARSALVRILLSQGKTAEATEVVRRVMRGTGIPGPDIYAAAYQMLAAQGLKEEAKAAGGKLLALAAEPRPVLNDLGSWMQSKVQQALYREALMAGLGDDPAVWHALGKAARAAENFAEAERAVRKAITINPQYYPAYPLLRNLLNREQRYREILELYDSAIRQGTATPEWLGHFHYGLGTAYKAMANWDAAIASFRKASEVAPSRAALVQNAITATELSRARKVTGARNIYLTGPFPRMQWESYQGEAVFTEGRVVKLLGNRRLQLDLWDSYVVAQTAEESSVKAGDRIGVIGKAQGYFTGVTTDGFVVSLPFIGEASIHPSAYYDEEPEFPRTSN